MSRHIMFNLTRPERSLILLAPLARSAGGYALCCARHHQARPVTVFAGTDDGDYQKILAMCIAGKSRLEEIKRFDMPGFTPLPQYVREMQRFGIITDAVAPIDPYRTDQEYWRAFWHKPPVQ